MSDWLREAMHAAASRQPAVPDRALAARRLHRLRRQRHERVAVAALAATLVANGTLLGVAGRGAPDQLATDPPASATPVPAPTPADSPSPSTTPSPFPSPARSEPGTPSPPEPSASEPYESPMPTKFTMSWTASSTRVKVGEVVAFTAVLESPDLGPSLLRVAYGDGRDRRWDCSTPQYRADAQYPPQWWDRSSSPSPTSEPSESPPASPSPLPSLAPPTPAASPAAQPTTAPPPAAAMPAPPPPYATIVDHYAFRRPGTFTVLAEAGHGCDGDRDVRERASLVVTVEPAGGDAAAAGNGPVRPHADFSAQGSVLVVYADDNDGWLRRVEVDWGDGREPDVWDRGGEGCTERSERDYWLPSEASVATARELEGTYTITMTVVTSACDGSAVQRTTLSQRLSMPAPMI